MTKYYLVVPAKVVGIAYTLDKAIEISQKIWDESKEKTELMFEEKPDHETNPSHNASAGNSR